MARRKSIAEKSLQFTGVFEAELLAQLMLRFWKHPHSDDREFGISLLEAAAQVLRSSIAGEQLIKELPPEQMSLVAAIWLAESYWVEEDSSVDSTERQLRIDWLESVRRSVPSCFCDQSLLDDEN